MIPTIIKNFLKIRVLDKKVDNKYVKILSRQVKDAQDIVKNIISISCNVIRVTLFSSAVSIENEIFFRYRLTAENIKDRLDCVSVTTCTGNADCTLYE